MVVTVGILPNFIFFTFTLVTAFFFFPHNIRGQINMHSADKKYTHIVLKPCQINMYCI